MYQNSSKINSVVINNGGVAFSTAYYWGSTQRTPQTVWMQSFSSAQSGFGKYYKK